MLVRHYQILPPGTSGDAKREEEGLVEIGPRFALVPIRIMGGCFVGETLYANEDFTSPNETRRLLRRQKAGRTVGGVAQKEKRRERIRDGADRLPEDELRDVFEA